MRRVCRRQPTVESDTCGGRSGGDMSKTKQKAANHNGSHGDTHGAATVTTLKAEHTADPDKRLGEKAYQHELRRLHGEIVALQEWVKASGTKVCIVFEGRDTAGKGGVIKAITERVSPRVFRVVALASPTERERSQ